GGSISKHARITTWSFYKTTFYSPRPTYQRPAGVQHKEKKRSKRPTITRRGQRGKKY
ncbi:Hypothetical predicted protein, partial [Pelobates cultripes]